MKKCDFAYAALRVAHFIVYCLYAKSEQALLDGNWVKETAKVEYVNSGSYL